MVLNNFVENFVTLIFLIAIDICRKKYNMQKRIEDIEILNSSCFESPFHFI